MYLFSPSWGWDPLLSDIYCFFFAWGGAFLYVGGFRGRPGHPGRRGSLMPDRSGSQFSLDATLPSNQCSSQLVFLAAGYRPPRVSLFSFVEQLVNFCLDVLVVDPCSFFLSASK